MLARVDEESDLEDESLDLLCGDDEDGDPAVEYGETELCESNSDVAVVSEITR